MFNALWHKIKHEYISLNSTDRFISETRINSKQNIEGRFLTNETPYLAFSTLQHECKHTCIHRVGIHH